MVPARALQQAMPSTSWWTARDIADEIGVPLHRVQYVLRSHRDAIRPALIASQTRLYPPDVVPHVRAALKGIEARRASRSADPIIRGWRALQDEEKAQQDDEGLSAGGPR